jgi:hypothetical protein
MCRRDALSGLTVLASSFAIACDAEAPASALPMKLSLPSATPRETIPETDLRLPRRAQGAPTGSAFIEATRKMTWQEREAAVLEQLLAGNVPDFLRRFVDVDVFSPHGPKRHTGRLRVMPDYLCIGSDEDFVRMPMNGRTAQRIARATNCTLPTSSIVEAVYRRAPVKLTSSALPQGAEMMSNTYFKTHNREIEENRRKAGGKLGTLTAGPKKDVVLSKRLEYEPRQLAIFGWYRRDGTPIQLLSTFHEDTYVDYTHGIRLVAVEMTVDGATQSVLDVLRDPDLCTVISGEGTVNAAYAA